MTPQTRIPTLRRCLSLTSLYDHLVIPLLVVWSLAALLAAQPLATAHAAAAAAGGNLPACGQTITGKVVNLTADTFSYTDLDERDTACAPHLSSLHAGEYITVGAQYTISFDLSNMDPAGVASTSFDAWLSWRRTDPHHKYSLHFLQSTVQMRVVNGPHFVALGSAPYSVPTGGAFAHLQLVVNGYTFTLSDRSSGATILSVTDAAQTFATGPTQLWYAQGNTFVCWDNVSGAPGVPTASFALWGDPFHES